MSLFLVIAVNSTWFQNFTELHALIHSYALLHLHMCFVEWVLVISFLAQMPWKDWKQNRMYISKVSKWFNLSREWLCTCSHKTTVFDTSSLRTVNCTRFQNFTELHVLTLAVRSYALFYALLIVEISNHDFAHITTKQQSLTLPLHCSPYPFLLRHSTVRGAPSLLLEEGSPHPQHLGEEERVCVHMGAQLEEHLHHMAGREVGKSGALLEVFQGTRRKRGERDPLGCPGRIAVTSKEREQENVQCT